MPLRTVRLVVLALRLLLRPSLLRRLVLAALLLALGAFGLAALPFSLLFFLTGAGYYAYTFLTLNRFTNMSALLLSVSVLIFLIGLVSEQITMLLFSRRDR